MKCTRNVSIIVTTQRHVKLSNIEIVDHFAVSLPRVLITRTNHARRPQVRIHQRNWTLN